MVVEDVNEKNILHLLEDIEMLFLRAIQFVFLRSEKFNVKHLRKWQNFKCKDFVFPLDARSNAKCLLYFTDAGEFIPATE